MLFSGNKNFMADLCSSLKLSIWLKIKSNLYCMNKIWRVSLLLLLLYVVFVDLCVHSDNALQIGKHVNRKFFNVFFFSSSLISFKTSPYIYIYIYIYIYPTRHQLYGHLPPITKTIQVRRTRHAGHCWRSKDELISDVLLWTPTYGCAKAGRPARTYIQQLCEDTGCNPEDLPEAMNDREKRRERVRDIRAGGATWWWWWWYIYMKWL